MPTLECEQIIDHLFSFLDVTIVVVPDFGKHDFSQTAFPGAGQRKVFGQVDHVVGNLVFWKHVKTRITRQSEVHGTRAMGRRVQRKAQVSVVQTFRL